MEDGRGGQEAARATTGAPRPTRGAVVRRVVPLVAVAVLSSLITVGAVSAATGTFTDVPDTHPFFDDIEAVAGACIAGGFADGTYKPAANVSRQAMAAFLNRTASKTVRGDKVGGTNPSFGIDGGGLSPAVSVAEVEVTVPDLPGACQVPVELHGVTNVNVIGTLGSACSANCIGRATLFAFGAEIPDATAQATFVASEQGFSLAPSAITTQLDGTTVTYSLRVRGFNVLAGKGGTSAFRRIDAVIHPMDATPVT